MSELIVRVQFSIRPLLALEFDGHGVGRAFDLLGDQIMEAFIAWIVGRGIIPTKQHLLPLGWCEKREFGNGLCGVVRRGVKQRGVVAEPSLDRLAIEEVAVVIATIQDKAGIGFDDV